MKIKLAATLGPSSSNLKTIYEMIKAGISAFRINMVYGSLDEKDQIIKSIRKIEDELEEPIPIIAEIKGRTLRIGNMPETRLDPGEKVVLEFGTERSEETHVIPVPYEIPTRIISPNDRILLADGRIAIRVDDIKDFEVEGTVIDGGILRSSARIALRRKSLLNLPPITREDEKIIDFLMKRDIDILMIPDVLDPSDLEVVRSFLDTYKQDVRILARIENAEALPKLEAIAEKSDGIVFAKENIENMLVEEERPISDMFLEDLAIRVALKTLKPILVVPPMLESLVFNSKIKRSDAVILANLVAKGFDGVILCSETAIGNDPINAVRTVAKIASEAEEHIELSELKADKDDPTYVKFNRGLVALANMINAKIAVYTTYGRTVLAIVRFRPKITVYGFANSKRTSRYLNVIWGAKPIYTKSMPDFETMKKELIKRNLARSGENIVFSYGWRPEIGPKQQVLIETL
ncbi:MAG: pyruvate kinase [Candidatus Korarchaeota archaeon]|nr:pyruvate kinase [Thermoproteota archaeon]MCR8471962.1 pyruvate kinase [Thermoproteota archaeon]MCR8473205.1 pyruvate kinase [Thermoproteota archaeon]MCR8488646.1 pyruvate kinase [Thermoproteota archaeon]